VRNEAGQPGGDRVAIIWIVAALVVGGSLTVAGVVARSAAPMIAGVALLFICSTATRFWYFRRRG